MSIGIFTDKERQPGQVEIQAALGLAYPLWERLVRFIEDAYGLPGEISFGGRKYGWNIWYRKGGKSLASIYPQGGGFTVQIVLGREQVEKVAGLELGDGVRTVFENTPQLHDGRWLFIPVQSERDVQDIEQIVLVRRKPIREKSGK
jgi:hypothetical protein